MEQFVLWTNIRFENIFAIRSRRLYILCRRLKKLSLIQENETVRCLGSLANASITASIRTRVDRTCPRQPMINPVDPSLNRTRTDKLAISRKIPINSQIMTISGNCRRFYSSKRSSCLCHSNRTRISQNINFSFLSIES